MGRFALVFYLVKILRIGLSEVIRLATIHYRSGVFGVLFKRGDSRAETQITRSKIYRLITTSKEPIYLS